MSGSTHVLVVDDEPAIVEVLQRYLSAQGFKVSTAENGAAVRRVIGNESVDLVLLDLGLPGEDGLALMRWLLDFAARRLDSPDGKAVYLTTGEFDLLAALVKCPGRVLSRDELLAATRNREAGPFDRTIDVQVGRLRRKIEADPQRPELIKS